MGYVGFAFPRYVIGPGNSHLPLNQSDAKQKSSTTTWSLAFSRALNSLVVFTLSSQWLLVIFPFFRLAVVITLALVLRHLIEKRSNNHQLVGIMLSKCRKVRLRLKAIQQYKH